jgi:hypothetical protein
VKQITLVCLMLVCIGKAYAQTGRLTGSVLDAQTKTPLELATVSILKSDSSLVTYQLSDKVGKFSFTKLPVKQSLLVTITYTGYTAFTSSLSLGADKTDTLTVLLDYNLKDTLVVTAVSPIKMNGDTLEINPAAFKMKEDAVVEEMLNQVSGITIWSDGSITINGKKVQTLLVDGKPFMGSTDSRVATQNLPKSAIDKIQLYQEYDRSNIGQNGRQQDSLLTMNIKLKESSKKGFFGKAGAGYGTTNRFETDLSFQTYTKKTSVGIGGGYNNINKTVGNLQEMFQNNTYRNYNPNLYNVGRFGASGINKNHSIGGVFTHSFIDAANSRQNNRIAINYNRSGVEGYLTDLMLQNRTAIDNPQFVRDEGVQRSMTQRQDLGINYVKTNSYNDNLNLNGALSSNKEEGNTTRFTEVRDSASRLQSTNNVITRYNRRGENKSINGSFAKSNNEDPLKSFNINFNARDAINNSDRNVRSVFESFIDSSKSNDYNRLYTTTGRNTNLNANLDYSGLKRLVFGRFNLFGIDLRLNQGIGFSRSEDNSRVSDYDSTSKQYVVNNKISNDNRRELFEYSPALSLTKSLFKWSGTHYKNLYFNLRLVDDIKTEKNRSNSYAARNVDRSFQFFRQDFNATYQYFRQDKYQYIFSGSYEKNYDYPAIDQLFTIVDDINVYETRIGNPFLRNRKDHRINLNANFNTQNPKSLYSVNGSANGGYTKSVNPITDSVINDPSGRRIYYYTNADKSNNLNLGYSFNISRRIEKSNLQLMYSGNFSTGKRPNYIDNIYNTSETKNLSNQFTVQFSLRSLLIFTVSQTFQNSKSKQSAVGLNSFSNANKISKFGVVLNYPKDFTFSSTMEQINNSNLTKPTMLWNAFGSYRFMKGQGELKASAMDILKQYRNITNNVNSYGTSTRVTNGLQQFYMLTFSYYPRKFGKTEIKRQSRANERY